MNLKIWELVSKQTAWPSKHKWLCINISLILTIILAMRKSFETALASFIPKTILFIWRPTPHSLHLSVTISFQVSLLYKGTGMTQHWYTLPCCFKGKPYLPTNTLPNSVNLLQAVSILGLALNISSLSLLPYNISLTFTFSTFTIGLLPSNSISTFLTFT